MNRFCWALLLLIVCWSAHAAEIRFEPRGESFDFQHQYTGGWEHFVGGGMATFDCNDDNFPDIFLSGGENSSRLAINRTNQSGSAISMQSVLNSGTEFDRVTGAYPIDIDSDGQLDLFVMRVGENKLLRGLSNCEFEEANDLWQFDGGDEWTTSFSATWEAGNDWPTFAVGNYVDRKDPEGPFGTCDTNKLFRPSKNGTYGPPIELRPGYCALSMLVSDWMRTGRRDLRISNDRHYYINDGEEQMWRLDELRALDRDDGWQAISVWGMGIASQDLNGDKKPDIVLTSMGDQLVQFYAGGAHMENAPFSIGSYAHRPYTGGDGRPSTGWHAEFGDVDNDSLPDLFIAKGNVDQMPGSAMKDPNNMLIQQPDGTFTENGLKAGLANMDRSRGAAMVDFNLDGKLDIALMNRRAPFELYENVTSDVGSFIAVTLKQDGFNNRAVGSWIEVRTANERLQTQELTIGGGHASGEAAPVHFGLGGLSSAELRVIWPDGSASDWIEISARRQVVVARNVASSTLTLTEMKTN